LDETSGLYLYSHCQVCDKSLEELKELKEKKVMTWQHKDGIVSRTPVPCPEITLGNCMGHSIMGKSKQHQCPHCQQVSREGCKRKHKKITMPAHLLAEIFARSTFEFASTKTLLGKK